MHAPNANARNISLYVFYAHKPLCLCLCLTVLIKRNNFYVKIVPVLPHGDCVCFECVFPSNQSTQIPIQVDTIVGWNFAVTFDKPDNLISIEQWNLCQSVSFSFHTFRGEEADVRPPYVDVDDKTQCSNWIGCGTGSHRLRHKMIATDMLTFACSRILNAMLQKGGSKRSPSPIHSSCRWLIQFTTWCWHRSSAPNFSDPLEF